MSQRHVPATYPSTIALAHPATNTVRRPDSTEVGPTLGRLTVADWGLRLESPIRRPGVDAAPAETSAARGLGPTGSALRQSALREVGQFVAGCVAQPVRWLNPWSGTAGDLALPVIVGEVARLARHRRGIPSESPG